MPVSLSNCMEQLGPTGHCLVKQYIGDFYQNVWHKIQVWLKWDRCDFVTRNKGINPLKTKCICFI
jgi:hypothetical protein